MEWTPIPSFPDYEAHPLGEIRHARTKRHPRQFCSGLGYHTVTIIRDGWQKNFQVHVLIAQTFLGPRPAEYDTDHVDGNKLNNAADNLEYVTHAENMRRSKRVRRGAAHPHTKLTDNIVREIRRREAAGEIADLRSVMAEFGIERKTLYNIRKRVTWKHL